MPTYYRRPSNHHYVGSILLVASLLSAAPRLVAATAAPRSSSSEMSQWVDLPPRAAKALTGKQFMALTKTMSLPKREEATYREVVNGNVPNFIRTLVPLTYTEKWLKGGEYTVTLFVSPDYLAVGSDDDYIRTPVNLKTALRIASDLDLTLPTRKVVDLIYTHAACQLSPAPMPADKKMTSSSYFIKHNAMIEKQKARLAPSSGVLISGHKKDIILTPKLLKVKDRIAIYGWHRTNGKAIQPVSTIHEATYVDYSHGLRLMSPLAIVNGKMMQIEDILKDPVLAPLLSDEGILMLGKIVARCSQK